MHHTTRQHPITNRHATRYAGALMVALVGLTAVGCKHELNIGAVLPLTGEHGIYGEASQRGLEMALDELRVAGDTRFQLTVVDSESDPTKARELLQQLYDNNSVAAIGGLTTAEAKELAPVAESAERVLLSPSATVRDQSPDARYFYSLATSDFSSGTSMATFAKRELKVKNAVVIGESDLDGGSLEKGFQTTFENQGGKILATLALSKNAALSNNADELEATVKEALAKKPAAIYLVGYEKSVASMVRELRQRQYRGKILTTQALAFHDSLEELGKDAHGVLLTHTVFEPDAEEHVGDFVTRFEKRYGQKPGIHAAESYDALMVLATAMAERPSLPSEVRKGLLHDVKDYRGVTGSLQFNEARGVPKIPRVYSIAKDLSLLDHGRVIKIERERIEQEKKALLKRLGDIRSAATSPSS